MAGLNISRYQVYNMTHNYSALFSSMNTSSQTNGWDLSGLTDYAAIKNGSYGKLLKKHYSSSESSDSTSKTSTILTAEQRRAQREAKLNKTESTTSESTTTASVSTKTTDSKDTVSSATNLAQAAQALQKSGLWEQKDITTKDATTGVETTTKDYDKEAITKAVQAFVDDYNAVIDNASSSSSTSVQRSAVSMENMTDRTAASVLKKVGITVGKDKKLTVDTDKLANADVSQLKSIFYGSGSYGSRVADKASYIAVQAGSATTTYTSTANKTQTPSELLSSLIDTAV